MRLLHLVGRVKDYAEQPRRGGAGGNSGAGCWLEPEKVLPGRLTGRGRKIERLRPSGSSIRAEKPPSWMGLDGTRGST